RSLRPAMRLKLGGGGAVTPAVQGYPHIYCHSSRVFCAGNLLSLRTPKTAVSPIPQLALIECLRVFCGGMSWSQLHVTAAYLKNSVIAPALAAFPRFPSTPI